MNYDMLNAAVGGAEETRICESHEHTLAGTSRRF